MTTLPYIVVGVDHTPSSTAAVRWAADEARRTGARLRAIHVWACSATARHRQLAGVEREEVQENATRWIVDAVAHTGLDVEITVEVLDGDPGPTLVSAADGANLLVLGANSFTPRGLPSSDLVEYCVVNSPCRVVVINGCDKRIPDSYRQASATAGVSTP
ncbi:universal stress protein [Flindersiella endophytica]